MVPQSKPCPVLESLSGCELSVHWVKGYLAVLFGMLLQGVTLTNVMWNCYDQRGKVILGKHQMADVSKCCLALQPFFAANGSGFRL